MTSPQQTGRKSNRAGNSRCVVDAVSTGHTRLQTLMALAIALFLGRVSRVGAHEGPPFPILMDQPTANYLVSVWADPDVGEARFFVALEPSQTALSSTVPPQVTLWCEPTTGRLPRVNHAAVRQPLRNRLQFLAEPYFDRRDVWRVGIRVTETGQAPQEFITELESTPPGLGLWDLAIYLFPFVLFGGLWVAAFVRRRRRPA